MGYSTPEALLVRSTSLLIGAEANTSVFPDPRVSVRRCTSTTARQSQQGFGYVVVAFIDADYSGKMPIIIAAVDAKSKNDVPCDGC